MDESGLDELLDAATHLVIEDGFDAVSIQRIARQAVVSEDQVLAHFGSLEDLLVAMLNREFGRLWAEVMDDIERDPLGGLLSHLFRYMLIGVYERPLVRALYLADRDGLNTIIRATHGFAYAPLFNTSPVFIDKMKEAGMIRPEVDSENLSAVLTAVLAGAALTAPQSQLDLVTEGLYDLLTASVDADVADTTPGKSALVEFTWSMVSPDAAQ